MRGLSPGPRRTTPTWISGTPHCSLIPSVTDLVRSALEWESCQITLDSLRVTASEKEATPVPGPPESQEAVLSQK